MTQIKGLLTEQICEIRKKSLSLRKMRTPNQAIASWIEDDRLLTGKGKSLVIIMNSSGCSWALGAAGGCSMCGYSNDTSLQITGEDLITQVKDSLTKFGDKDFQAIKLFNSGSFLDSNEIPQLAQKEILELIARRENIAEVIVESRPEFVKKEKILELKKFLGEEITLEIGIGLESSNDKIRIDYINKGFLIEDFKKAVKIINENGAQVKSYLLFKPPFITEKAAIEDTIQSIIDSIKIGAQSISINPLNIQNGTLVYNLWKDNLYRPPWFWSLQEVLQNTWQRIEDEGLRDSFNRIVSDPSGAGSRRGIHNCRNCNRQFIKTLKKYTLNQDPTVFYSTKCECHATWEEFLDYEELSQDQSLHLVENARNILN